MLIISIIISLLYIGVIFGNLILVKKMITQTLSFENSYLKLKDEYIYDKNKQDSYNLIIFIYKILSVVISFIIYFAIVNIFKNVPHNNLLIIFKLVWIIGFIINILCNKLLTTYLTIIENYSYMSKDAREFLIFKISYSNNTIDIRYRILNTFIKIRLN